MGNNREPDFLFGLKVVANLSERPFYTCVETCIGILGIQDTCHFTSGDRILSVLLPGISYSIFWSISGILNI